MTTSTTTTDHPDGTSGAIGDGRRPSGARRSRVPAIVGVAYAGSWIVGLSIWPNNLKASANGAEVLAAFTGHRIPSFLNYAFTEGLPAAGLGVVGLALAMAARRAGEPRRAYAVATAAVTAALISVTQFVLGALLTLHAVPSGDASSAYTLFETVNRLDGVKMFALAVLALAAARVGSRWLRFTAYALAVTIIGSGVGYLFLVTALTNLAFVSGPLLLLWITGSGIAQSRTTR